MAHDAPEPENKFRDLLVMGTCVTVISGMISGPILGVSLATLAMVDSVWLLLFTR
jgi:hypothetical protein